MSTAFSSVLEAFFNKVQNDADFFNYYNLSEEDAIEIATQRAEGYLMEAIAKLTLKCTPDVDFYNYSTEHKCFLFDLVPLEIEVLACLMFEMYLLKDISKLKAFVLRMSPTDLNVFSPANERKTFIDMVVKVQNDNRVIISEYASRDRISGKEKSINYIGLLDGDG